MCVCVTMRLEVSSWLSSKGRVSPLCLGGPRPQCKKRKSENRPIAGCRAAPAGRRFRALGGRDENSVQIHEHVAAVHLRLLTR